ncbi:MAG: TIR domain-containing protein [Candidatus Competibacteraceae bacterium]
MTTEKRIIEKIAALENIWRRLLEKRDNLQRLYILESRVEEKLRLETIIKEIKEELLQAENQLSELESKIEPISKKPNIANVRRNDLEKGEPISIFYSYSHQDESFRQILETHLYLLKRQGIIGDWHDRRIAAGTEWKGSIDQHMERAQLILLLISQDYLASDYCYDIEMKRALERHKSHEARVIPIILRPADWSGGLFSELQALPSGGKPVTLWSNRDEAFLNIVSSIRQVCYDILTQKNLETESEKVATAETFFSLEEVFLASGIPSITFVEPLKFKELKSVLKQPGRGVVIEGPSGIGKTTALVKAANAVLKDFDRGRDIYSARDPQKIKKLKTLQDWHKGIIVIDDFHRLAQDHELLRNNIIDYLKYLADIKASDKKLVIIGIPKTGRHLVELSPDIATRIRVFPLTKVPPYIVLEMISKGEMALNIRFDKKEDIANQASGSLNIAQMLCYYSAPIQVVEFINTISVFQS